jgi:hypothetical protein
MRKTLGSLIVFAAITGAGCKDQVAVAPDEKAGQPYADVAPGPHFDAAPPIPMPRRATPQEEEGLPSSIGTSSPLAQTFTCAADGELAEIQFGIDKASPTPIEVSMELRSLTENTIDDNASNLKFSSTIAASQIGQGGYGQGALMRVDVRPFKIQVHKGDKFAIIFRPTSENGNNQYRMVNGHTYAGGDNIMEWNGMTVGSPPSCTRNFCFVFLQ